MTFKPNFIFTGLTNSNVDTILKTIIPTYFMDIRHLAVQELNPRYDEWNNEFVDIFGTRENYYEDEDYRKFMSGKQNEILQKYDNQYKGFKVRSGDDLDIIGYYDSEDKHVTIELELIPI